MNRLSKEKRTQILRLLVEGNSLRSCSRIADVTVHTVMRLLIAAGKACTKFHDETVIGVTPAKLQLDETLTFVYAKEYNVHQRNRKNPKGKDAWTWIAMDPDTKLVLAWHIGNRQLGDGDEFFEKLIKTIKLENKILISTDGYKPYWPLTKQYFGRKYAELGQMMKYYGREIAPGDGEHYARGRFIKTEKFIRIGNPNPKDISTSYIERQNLTLRMCNRRYTRKTNAFSKKWENHLYSVALHFVYYNFVRLHKTLNVTPAMAAKLTKRFMKLEDIVTLIELMEEGDRNKKITK